MTALQALQRSFLNFLKPALLIRILVPIFTATLVWFGLVIFYWSSWLETMSHFLQDTWLISASTKLLSFMVEIEPLIVASWVGTLFLIVIVLFALYFLILMTTSLILLPLLTHTISQESFPLLEKKRGGSIVGSIWNSVSATVIYFGFFIVLLPFFLIPGLQIVIPVLLNALVTQKIFCYDILQDYASREERQYILKEKRAEIFLLALAQSVFFYIPILNFIAPAIGAMSFIYFLLSHLEQMRLGKIK
ncbi:MAG: membrane protein [Oligoflexia bacterium]|nr:MAG: membrane protein [Oligoflexia bacterium]